MTVVHMIGNAHIDPVWLWPWQVGVDEALATCRSAADRCDEYPEFIFTRGEAWIYRWVEKLDPQLFERIRRLVSIGQWHVTGGQFVQPDSNLPTEFGWRRQLRHGRAYFREKFGVMPQVAYQVDSFGHPLTLPDILAEEGYIGFVFHRPSPEQLPLPAQTFRWRGPKGGEVLGFRIVPSYTYYYEDLYERIMMAVEASGELGHTMCFFGVGNHGGGPTKAQIEYILDHYHAWEGIELRFSTPQAFFEAIYDQRDRLPIVTEELQHTFPGCYSVMHDIKQRQRRAEHLLAQAEDAVRAFVDEPQQAVALHERLNQAWEDLLLTEFHDVLAGTAAPRSWDSVRAIQGRAQISGEEVMVEATRRWAHRHLPAVNEHQLVVMNPDPAPWRGYIEAEPWLDFRSWDDRWVSDLDGNPVDHQVVQPDAPGTTRILFPAEVGAMSALQLLVRQDPNPTRNVTTDLHVSDTVLENTHLRVEVGERGVEALWSEDKLLLEGIGLHLRTDHTDTWTFHTDRFDEPVESEFMVRTWVVEEQGPLRARLRAEGRLGESRVRWTLSLHRGDPKLHIKLEVLFAERYRMLQMPLWLASNVQRWRDGQAGGWVERTCSAVEWPVQGWSMVDLNGRQLAIVTQDAYSLSLDDRRWQWTLLRSSRMAWMGQDPEVYGGRDEHTDQGPHTFEFVLWVGKDLGEEALEIAARQQARPPIVFDRYEGLVRPL